MRSFRNLGQAGLCGMIFVLCVGAASLGIAQEPGPPPPDGMQGPPGMQPPKMDVDKEIARMTKRYALTDAQKTQVRPILVEQQHKMELVFQDSSLSPEDRFAKIRAIHDEQVSRVSEVLSDSQRSKYQKDQKEMGPGPEGMPPPPDGGGGPPNA